MTKVGIKGEELDTSSLSAGLDQLVGAIQHNIRVAMDVLANTKPEALYVPTCVGVTAMNIMAIGLGSQEDESKDTGVCVETLTLAACLLLAASEGSNDEDCQCSASPRVLFNALTAAEKLLGRNIDKYIDPGLVKAARTAGAAPNAAIIEKMEFAKQTGRYLN